MEIEDYGNWKILEFAKPFCKCICKCGTKKNVRWTNLRNGSSKSCGCLSKLLRKEQGRVKTLLVNNKERGLNYLYSQYKSHAKYNSRKFTLTKEEFSNIVFSNCHYCGNSPSNLVKNSKYGGPFYYNGIDRKNTKGHYTLNNSLPCCIICNKAKSDLKYEEFREWSIRLFNKFGNSK